MKFFLLKKYIMRMGGICIAILMVLVQMPAEGFQKLLMLIRGFFQARDFTFFIALQVALPAHPPPVPPHLGPAAVVPDPHRT